MIVALYPGRVESTPVIFHRETHLSIHPSGTHPHLVGFRMSPGINQRLADNMNSLLLGYTRQGQCREKLKAPPADIDDVGRTV